MWLSSKGQQTQAEEESPAQLGEVTVSGAETAVFLSGERRNIQLVSPGGYHWRPQEGETVLVLKTDGEAGGCLLGRAAEPSPFAPGSIWISPDGENGIALGKGGDIRLVGNSYLNGVLFSVPAEEEQE